MKIIIDSTATNEWYFRIVGKNGKTLAHSEPYTRKRNAREAAELITNGTMTIVEHA